jgi:hypothetical protein
MLEIWYINEGMKQTMLSFEQLSKYDIYLLTVHFVSI